MLMPVALCAVDATAPSLIIHDAEIRTMDAAQPRAEAVAIGGNRILAVGNSGDILRLRGPDTRVLAAKGKTVLPGFNDAHLHFLSGGFQLSRVDLRDARSPAEFARRVEAFAKTLPPGTWMLGGDWDHEAWPGTPLPTREMIDAVTPSTPVFIRRLDGHMALANGLALKLAGLTPEVVAPPGGEIVRDGSGELSGIFKDAAMELVGKVIPEPSFDEKLAAARAASTYAASLGVTSVQDMSAGSDIAVYRELQRRGELKTRIYGMFPLSRWNELARLGITAGFGDPMLRIGGLKAFSDGSLGSTTALFFEPYADAPQTRGLPSDEMFPDGAMLERVMGADASGLQVMIHAIGDRANHLVLEMFEKALARNSARERRFRIEHAQHLRLQDIGRFPAARVIASMQPYHAADDGRWAEKRIGPSRLKGTYAFRSLLDAKGSLAFGSDWTVAPLNPLLGIHAAVTRETLDGKNPEGWVPEQRISMEEAIHAYTMGSALAEFTEQEKGSITPGKLADLVLLDRNIFERPLAELKETRVLFTVCDGQILFERKQ